MTLAQMHNFKMLDTREHCSKLRHLRAQEPLSRVRNSSQLTPNWQPIHLVVVKYRKDTRHLVVVKCGKEL